MAQSESTSNVATATESLLNACQSAVWFQHHCSQNDRSDGLLATELDALACVTSTSAISVQRCLPQLVGATPPTEMFFGIGGVCHHEIAVAILKYILRDVHVIGGVGPIPYSLAGKKFDEHKCVRDWSKVRQYMAVSAYRINEPDTLNATPEFDRLCVVVRRESIVACEQAPDDHDGHVSKADLDTVVGQFLEFKTIQNKFKPKAAMTGSNNRSMYLYSEIRKLYLEHDAKLGDILPATYSEFRLALQSVQSGQ